VGTTKGKLEHRLVFVSHSHADRELASALSEMISTVFSGVVETFVSSDPGPTGGIMPGDQWYGQVETKLCQAEAVWVLATPASVKSPWIYWEAGIGRALCPKGLVVLRVKLGASDIPSPLDTFQSFDGLQSAQVGELLGKVGNQIAMSPPIVLIDSGAQAWVAIARDYEPVQENVNQLPTIAPERLDRLDAAIARLEGVWQDRSSVDLDERMQRILQVVGTPELIYRSLGGFVRAIERVPADTVLEATHIDRDGDLSITAHRGGQIVRIYVHSSLLSQLREELCADPRAREVMAQLVITRDEHSNQEST